MTITRQQPDPIHDQLVARTCDATENALDPQATARALHRVLDICWMHEHNALRWQDQLPVPSWVAKTREAIAEALGIPMAGDQQETGTENTGGWPDPVRSALETEALTSWAAAPGRDAWLTTARDGYVAGYTIARCTRKDRP